MSDLSGIGRPGVACELGPACGGARGFGRTNKPISVHSIVR